MSEPPWPPRGRRRPPASVEAAVGVRRPLPQNPGSVSGRDWCASLCGSGLGRDSAVAVRRLRYRPPSGSEDPSHRILAQAPAVNGAPPLWERPWPRLGRRRPPASVQAAVGVGRPLPQNPGAGSGRDWCASHCESGLGRDTAVTVRRLRYRSPSGSEDPSHRIPAQAPAVTGAPPIVRAALAATRPSPSASFGTGRRRGRKTPPTESRLRPRP